MEGLTGYIFQLVTDLEFSVLYPNLLSVTSYVPFESDLRIVLTPQRTFPCPHDNWGRAKPGSPWEECGSGPGISGSFGVIFWTWVVGGLGFKKTLLEVCSVDIVVLFLLAVISEPVIGSINCPLATAWNHLKQRLQLRKYVSSVGMSIRNYLTSVGVWGSKLWQGAPSWSR